ncbi:DUF2726 domain-containing protein [Cereibacter johrii]|uniref:DUF2726 domain-containing protein n=1 Tax=Cereibacter johrii TaxID=445629 RepID=UPI002B21D1E4|nr:DUF2726 domain-containing protein [Cereibacter johrii]MEA5163492.1 DUF2726 domain-containing protein [Cereibacter johrii]
MDGFEPASVLLSDGQIPTGIWLALALLVALVLVLAVLRIRFETSYTARPVLNGTEQRLFRSLSRAISSLPEPRPRLLCQVSYGEFLAARSQKAFWRINAKRADFLLVDADFRPLLVIEYQGRGHYGRTRRDRRDAIGRDATKRRACASAGIPWMELPADYSAQSLRETLHAALAPIPELKEPAHG